MYLNLGTGKNKVIGKINGKNILLYGHVLDRYNERVRRLQKLTGINNLKYDAIIRKAVQAIEENYEACVTKDGKPVRNVIDCNVKVRCNNVVFDIEVAVLVKSTKVEWANWAPKEVAKDYVPYVENNEIKLGDIVIAIETIAATIKEEKERSINFSLMNKIEKIHVPKCIYNVNLKDLDYIVRYFINVPTMRSEYAYNFIKGKQLVVNN